MISQSAKAAKYSVDSVDSVAEKIKFVETTVIKGIKKRFCTNVDKSNTQ